MLMHRGQLCGTGSGPISCRRTTPAQHAARLPLCRAAQTPDISDTPLRIWAVSDIHTDYAGNLEWVWSLAHRGFGCVLHQQHRHVLGSI